MIRPALHQPRSRCASAPATSPRRRDAFFLRAAFTAVVRHYNPASLYTGTLSAVIVVVFWIYYGALMFTFGGLISQVHERRLAEELQRTLDWKAR